MIQTSPRNLIETAETLVVGKDRFSPEVRLSADPTVRLFLFANRRQLIMFAQVESLRSWLHELEGLVKEYSPLMEKPTERVVDKAIKYGVAFAEVSPTTWKPAGR